MDLLRLEQQRQALEKSLETLRASLKYWQTYEAELEGFREEVQSSPGDVDLEAISKTYSGELVNENEIRDLAGLDMQSPRTGTAVLGMVSRRQEYVQRNIETVQRQYWDSEAKLEELDFVAFSSTRDGVNGTGLPLTEIHEELDDEGNVISSSLSQPETATTKIVDALRQAGLSEQDLEESPDGSDAVKNAASIAASVPSLPRSALVDNPFKLSDTTTSTNGTINHDGPHRPPARKKSVSFTVDTKPAPEPVRQNSEDGKKTVSFNDKVAVMPSAPPPDSRTVSFSPQIEEIPAETATPGSGELAKSPSEVPKELQNMMFKAGEKVTEINDEDEVVETHIIIPEDETEEEARMRREMLQYHLHEVGHVVAQLDLEEDEMDEEENASASDFASEYLDEDTPYTSGHSDTEDESEDEFGRSRRRVVSDDYHKEMRELERRLIGNLGPTPDAQDINADDPELDSSDVRRLVIRDKSNSTSTAGSDNSKKSNSKKRVSFAESLDVSDEPKLPPTKAAKHEESENNTAPLSETVSERATSASESTTPVPTKLSQFKNSRDPPVPNDMSSSSGFDDNGAPTGPPGKILAETLLERPAVKRNVAAPSADDPDPIMQRRELAAEYYRRRNDIIRQQGGFKASAEDEELGEWMEEKDGKLKKVSKFKAARIRPQ